MEPIKGVAIQGINPELLKIGSKPSGGAGPDSSFNEVLKESIDNVNKLQTDADKSIKELVAGKSNIHDTMIAVEKANLSFNMMLQVRNKLLAAYEEIMRTQV